MIVKRRTSFKAHLRYTHYFTIEVFDRHAQQTVRFITSTGIDIVVKTCILKITIHYLKMYYYYHYCDIGAL